MATKIGNNGDNTLDGTNGADRLDGRGGNDILNGLAGNDRLIGGDGIDQLFGGDGNDILDGGLGEDVLNGGNGDDVFLFSEFREHIDGGGGTDTISFASAGSGVTLTNDSWNSAGGSVTGVEVIVGSKYADHIDQSGSFHPDGVAVHGGAGSDFITSDGTLFGEGGDDRLVPQGTNQYGSWTPDVYGGAGRDTFQIDYNSGDGITNGDGAIIHDFVSGKDTLEFNGVDEATLSNNGDMWTIQYFDTDLQANNDISFEIDGVTFLDTSDYIFV